MQKTLKEVSPGRTECSAQEVRPTGKHNGFKVVTQVLSKGAGHTSSNLDNATYSHRNMKENTK